MLPAMSEPAFNPYQPPRDDEPAVLPDPTAVRKPVEALRVTLMVLFGLTSIGILAKGYGLWLLLSAFTGEDLSRSNEAARFNQQLGMFALLSLIATATLWFIWSFRCNRNLRALGFDLLEFTPGATVWWWFVPFANLVRPYQIMRELLLGSVAASRGETGLIGASSSRAVGLWWTFYLLGNLVETLATQLMGLGERSNIILGVQINFVAVPLQLLAAGFAVKLVIDISRAQTQALARPAST